MAGRSLDDSGEKEVSMETEEERIVDEILETEKAGIAKRDDEMVQPRVIGTNWCPGRRNLEV